MSSPEPRRLLVPWAHGCCPRRELTQENRTQTLPETTTTASNKATNTSSLSMVSICMLGTLLRSFVSVRNPDEAPY